MTRESYPLLSHSFYFSVFANYIYGKWWKERERWTALSFPRSPSFLICKPKVESVGGICVYQEVK